MALDNKLIDQMPADYKKPEDIIGERGLQKQLTRAILEPALAAEMTDHLRYEKHDPVGNPQKLLQLLRSSPRRPERAAL